ncbi:MAG: Panacea domain-containing protein [Candidatus Sumerlaeota bacterium]|nr:Panacea domain-containing protein [Candidatus Sumerlaeota bacterium]
MHIRCDVAKATEAACQFLRRAGGTMSVLKLVKMVYLLDRLSIQRRGIPVVGGTYFSLRNGPMTSEVLDLINAGRLWGAEEGQWEELISDRQGHLVSLRGAAPREHLSDSEVALIEEVHSEHGAKDQWALCDWCHEHCEEWSPLEDGRDLISIERIAQAVGKTGEEIERMKEEIAETSFLEAALRAR